MAHKFNVSGTMLRNGFVGLRNRVPLPELSIGARLRPTLFNVPLSMSASCFSARHWADRIGARKFKLRHYLCRDHHLSNTRPGVAHQGIARCVSPLHERPMPKPHPFATAPATKGRARTVPKPNVTVYSYARVSTGGQSVDAQARQLRAAGAGTVFREVASGVAVDRPQLGRLLSEVAAGRRGDGDAARPPRSLDPRPVEHACGDYREESRLPVARRRMGRYHHGARPLMLTILGGLAEFERELIRTRTSEGRAHAKANGKSVGRKPKLTPHQKRKPFAGATRASQSADRTHLQCQCQYDFEAD